MSLFGLMPEQFNSLSNDEKEDKIEKILYMPFYFGLCVSKKGENDDYLKVAFDFEKLRQSMREEQVRGVDRFGKWRGERDFCVKHGRMSVRRQLLLLCAALCAFWAFFVMVRGVVDFYFLQTDVVKLLYSKVLTEGAT